MTEYTNDDKDVRPAQPSQLSPDSAGATAPEFSDRDDVQPESDNDPTDVPDEPEHSDYDAEHDVHSLEPDYDAEETDEQ